MAALGFRRVVYWVRILAQKCNNEINWCATFRIVTQTTQPA